MWSFMDFDAQKAHGTYMSPWHPPKGSFGDACRAGLALYASVHVLLFESLVNSRQVEDEGRATQDG